MKPTWKDAPDWAQYLAMDEDGKWYWYENEPTPDGGDDDEWLVENGGKYDLAHAYSPDWTKTLEPRPTTPDYNAMADAEYEQYVKDITAEELEDDNSA